VSRVLRSFRSASAFGTDRNTYLTSTHQRQRADTQGQLTTGGWETRRNLRNFDGDKWGQGDTAPRLRFSGSTARPEGNPLLLAQLARYRAAVEKSYPGQPVVAAFLSVDGRMVMAEG